MLAVLWWWEGDGVAWGESRGIQRGVILGQAERSGGRLGAAVGGVGVARTRCKAKGRGLGHTS